MYKVTVFYKGEESFYWWPVILKDCYMSQNKADS